METLQFRKILAKELINNPYWKDNKNKKKKIDVLKTQREHVLVRILCGQKFKETKLVTLPMIHIQTACIICNKKICTYCQCTLGIYWPLYRKAWCRGDG